MPREAIRSLAFLLRQSDANRMRRVLRLQALSEEIELINLDELRPIDALNILSHLKKPLQRRRLMGDAGQELKNLP